jgi:hypothetical protein
MSESISNLSLQKISGDDITDTHISEAADLFSSAYGVWGPQAAPQLGLWAKEGTC